MLVRCARGGVDGRPAVLGELDRVAANGPGATGHQDAEAGDGTVGKDTAVGGQRWDAEARRPRRGRCREARWRSRWPRRRTRRRYPRRSFDSRNTPTRVGRHARSGAVRLRVNLQSAALRGSTPTAAATRPDESAVRWSFRRCRPLGRQVLRDYLWWRTNMAFRFTYTLDPLRLLNCIFMVWVPGATDGNMKSKPWDLDNVASSAVSWTE